MVRKAKTSNSPKAKRIPFRVSERGFRFVFVHRPASDVRSLYSSSMLYGSHSVGRSCGLPMSVIRSPSFRSPFPNNKSVAVLARLRSVVSLQFRSARRSATPGIKKAAELRYRSPPLCHGKSFVVHVLQYMRFLLASFKNPCEGSFNHDN